MFRLLQSIFVMLLFRCSSALQRVSSYSLLKSPKSLFSIASGRLSASDLPLDASLLAGSSELVISHLISRRGSSKTISEVNRVHLLREERNALIKKGDEARNLRKVLSKEIGALMKSGRIGEMEALKLKVEEANKEAARVDELQAQVDADINTILSQVPNLLDDRVPDGVDENDNVVLLTWESRARKVGDSFRWHDDIASSLGGYDVDAAARISGARFSVLVGQIARLERAIIQFFLDSHIEKGYVEVAVPYIVSRSTLYGTGQLPKFEEDLFRVSHSVAGEDAFLIPTAEVPVTNLFRNCMLNDTQLPISLVCHSPSFRAEAGSYGRDTRGLLRQHQFQKVELVKICQPSQSKEEHEKLVQDAEDLLKALELPYRKILLCSGDTGFSARICYDLEVWLPGQQMYREISSVSNCYDFQARRMMLRYRSSGVGQGGKKGAVSYAHTLNGSGLAVGRTLVAVLENYQRADGTVEVPAVLRKYMGGLETMQPIESSFIY